MAKKKPSKRDERQRGGRALDRVRHFRRARGLSDVGPKTEDEPASQERSREEEDIEETEEKEGDDEDASQEDERCKGKR